MWFLQSLPSRECGLKSLPRPKAVDVKCHSPRGSVDWNCWQTSVFIGPLCHSPRGSVDWNVPKSRMGLGIEQVTPLAGVWIEIDSVAAAPHSGHASLPSRECGLKLSSLLRVFLYMGHSPRGSVDWNPPCQHLGFVFQVTPLAGVWIEILEQNY